MIIWLDNQDNHKDAINENFGRELLELFSMGVGNYTEQDVQECARAFTGWTLGNREYMELRSMRDSDWPYGRISWHFEFQEEDHDFGDKEFLGQRGQLNGDDIVDIICQQEATARFIARHMYSFFVADEPPVPEWPYTEPQDPAAIDLLVQAYFDSGYNIAAMLRALFNADFFKDETIWYRKVKSPVELVAGVLRLTGEFDRPRKEILERYQQAVFMGQFLNNPPSVEGWHQGIDWIDTGSLCGAHQLRLPATGRHRQARRQRHGRAHRPRHRRQSRPRCSWMPAWTRWARSKCQRIPAANWSTSPPWWARPTTPTAAGSPRSSRWWRPPTSSKEREIVRSVICERLARHLLD